MGTNSVSLSATFPITVTNAVGAGYQTYVGGGAWHSVTITGRGIGANSIGLDLYQTSGNANSVTMWYMVIGY